MVAGLLMTARTPPVDRTEPPVDRTHAARRPHGRRRLTARTPRVDRTDAAGRPHGAAGRPHGRRRWSARTPPVDAALCQPSPVIVGRVAVLCAGAALVLWTLGSAIRTVVVPRASQVALTRVHFRG